MYNIETVAGNIRAERARKNWTIEQLANESGVSKDSIAAYESAKTGMGLDKACAICKALGITMNQLVGE